MRRSRFVWFVAGVGLIGALGSFALLGQSAPTGVSAGAATPLEYYLDCAPGGAIDAACVLPSGTTSVDIDVVVKNNTGDTLGLSAFEFAVQTDNQPAFAPTTPVCLAPGTNCNPDFNDDLAGFIICDPPPASDQNQNPLVAESHIGCYTGNPAPPFIANGTSVVLGTVHYATSDGLGAFRLKNTRGSAGALFFDELINGRGSCNPTSDFVANCFGTTVQIGSSSATNTPGPTDTPTVTEVPSTYTPTPGGCPQTSPPTSACFTPTPAASDADSDGIPNTSDNCPGAFNPDQSNTDARPRTTIGAPSDTTLASGDGLGDVCDPDMDNDGIPNASEYSFGCNYGVGSSGPLDAYNADTDGDAVIDGAECALGSNPNNALSRPIVPSPDSDGDGLSDAFETSIDSDPHDVDSDDDGVTDGVEVKGYGTSPINPNTDGDGCPDGQEIASVDGNSAVNSIDLQLVAQRFGRTDRPVQDVNKSGSINSLDLQLIAKNFAPSSCASFFQEPAPVSPPVGAPATPTATATP